MTLFYQRFTEEMEFAARINMSQEDADYWFVEPFQEGEEPCLGYVDISLIGNYFAHKNLLPYEDKLYALLNFDVSTKRFYLCGRFDRRARLHIGEDQAITLQQGEPIFKVYK